MNKMRKGKKMLLLLLIVIVIVIAIIVGINVFNKIPKQPEEPVEEQQQSIPLPEITYSDMQVKNIHMTLLKGNHQDGSDETLLSMEIHNTTDEKVEKEKFTAVLFDANENEVTKMSTSMRPLNPGEQHNVQVVLKGDVTATTHIKLIKNQ